MSSMKIEKVALFNLNRITNVMDSLTYRLSTGKKINSSKDDPCTWVTALNSHSAFNCLDSVNSSLNMIATNIRIADVSMDTIGDCLDNMSSQLEMIINNYPPCPPGSPERAELLKNFNFLRQQIDQVTSQPDHEGAQKIMSDPSVVSGAGDWEIIVGENGVRKTIHSQQVHTGPTGLNIPELPESATDSEIVDAFKNLQSAKGTLEQRRRGLACDAASIPRWQEHNTRMANFHRNRAERIENADMYEVTAQIRIGELKHALNIEMIRSITTARSQLLEL
jgi:flagellin-like hook-associated protein FlgL